MRRLALTLVGIANAINIIDGFNGLASVVTICMLVSLAYVAWQVGDVFVLCTALMVAGATAGFLIWNYPIGMIFLDDGGACFIGFMLGELALLLVIRNPAVSTWYAALLLLYPVFETRFSAYRRMFLREKSPTLPDGIHLHSLIFRRIVPVGYRKKGNARPDAAQFANLAVSVDVFADHGYTGYCFLEEYRGPVILLFIVCGQLCVAVCAYCSI